MITKLRVSNFRGFAKIDREFALGCTQLHGCVTSVVGPAASGKSTLSSALELLQAVARGIRSTQQLQNGDLTAISTCLESPCDIVVSFVVSGVTYQYGLRLECDVPSQVWQIEDEWLSEGTGLEPKWGPVFARTGEHVEIGGTSGNEGCYDLDRKVFVLSTFVTPDRQHPVSLARAYLANLFVFGDGAWLLDDRIPEKTTPCYLWPRGENIGAWLSFQMGNRAELYRALTEALRRHLPRFGSLAVTRESVSGSHLSVVFARTAAGGTERTVPLRMISSTERTIFLGAVMVAIGRVFPAAVCIGDDFDSTEAVCPNLAREIGRVYSETGHLVAFHRRNNCLFQNVSLRLTGMGAEDVST